MNRVTSHVMDWKNVDMNTKNNTKQSFVDIPKCPCVIIPTFIQLLESHPEGYEKIVEKPDDVKESSIE